MKRLGRGIIQAVAVVLRFPACPARNGIPPGRATARTRPGESVP